MNKELNDIAEKVDSKVYTYQQALDATLEYFNGDDLAASVWVSKYALKDSNDNYYELTPADMHKRIAKEFARIENKYSNAVSEDEIFSLLSNFSSIVPQGSPMSGIGNNLQISSLSNCFVVDHKKGDSYGAIFKTDEESVQLMKRRGGVGNDISAIRPAGLKVNNAAITSTGILPFMDRYSNSTREVAMGGRRGARMLTISIKHPEAEEFINAKKDLTKVTGANISVRIDDAFMEAVVNDTTYMQQWPVDSDNPVVKKEIRAKDLWDKLIKNNHASGEPGILFWDQILKNSLPDCYKDLGFNTISTNPCGEIPLCDADSCRLLVVNLYDHVANKFKSNCYFDWEKFKRTVYVAQKLMDDLVDLELEKIDAIIQKIASDNEPDYVKQTEYDLWHRIRTKCIQGRRTGLGITGEGDMIAALGLRYGTKEATDFSEEVHKIMCLTAYRSSVDMAKERGAFELYDAQRESQNPFMVRIADADPELYVDMLDHGRRNIALLTCAPTGTTSIMTQTTSGIEPAFLVVYKRRRKINPNDKSNRADFVDVVGDSWEEYNVFHHAFKTWLDVSGYDFDVVEKMPLDELQTIIEKSPYYGALSNDVDWVESIKLQGAVQKWICHSISKTCNLPSHATEKIVEDVYISAWREGCKGVTVYRDGSRSGVLISTEDKTAKTKEELFSESHAPKRPKYLDCDVHRFVNKGERWIVFVGLFEGRPYEVFTGRADALTIPHSATSGRVRKTKIDKDGERVSKYDFIYVDHTGATVEVEWLNRAFNKEYWNYAKFASAILRHGMPLPYVVDLINSLNLEDDLINTWKSGTARMIKKYIPDGTTASDKSCKSCGADAVIYQEGCLVCANCGSSKCS